MNNSQNAQRFYKNAAERHFWEQYIVKGAAFGNRQYPKGTSCGAPFEKSWAKTLIVLFQTLCAIFKIAHL
ncbi:MAG: hypothetical protein II685_07845 [Clostridia bacterium]|nr:hypothetical protein [Clostridia bacterium]